jgi:hypothetical protein
MPKTPLQDPTVARLAALNDQLCFFLLLEHQLLDRLKDFSPSISANYTAEVFARNPYASRIHVTLDKLPRFQLENRALTFAAYFSLSYEVASGYFEDAEELVKALLGPPPQPIGNVNGGPEDRYRVVLQRYGLAPLPRLFLETMSYLRYRRNAFAHLGASPQQVFVTFATTNGAALNADWSGRAAPVDFTVATVASLAEEETISSLKVFREIVQGLDEHLGSQLPIANVVESIAAAEFDAKPTRINSDVIAFRKGMLAARLQRDFGLMAGDAVLDAAARRHGVR